MPSSRHKPTDVAQCLLVTPQRQRSGGRTRTATGQSRHFGCVPVTSGLHLPAQPVDATQALNLSAGVSNCMFARGRLFGEGATLFRWACDCADNSVPFGKYCLSRPLVFSFDPRCHGLCGSQNSGDDRAKPLANAAELLGNSAADDLLEADVQSFPGPLGITHRDLPEMVARGYADV